MPTLPIYNAKQNVDTQAPAPLSSAQPYLRNDATAAAKNADQITSTIADIGQKWSDANDVMQYTDAKAKHAVALASIESQAAADPDPKNADKYMQMLGDAKDTALSGISNQLVASKAGSEFNLDSQITGIKIQTNFRTKQLAINQVNVKTNLDSLLQSKLQAPAGSPLAQQYDLQIQNLLKENVATGTLSPEDAQKMLEESQKTSVQYQIYNDPSTAEQDSALLNQLKDPKGKYDFLDPKTRLDLIQESQRRIFQNNQTFKRQVDDSQVQRNSDFIGKLSDQTATFKDIDQEMAIPESQGGIKRGTLLQYKRFLENGVDRTLNEWMKEKVNGTQELTNRATMAKQYNDLIENYLDDKTDQWKAKELLAKGLADGHLDADELKVLDPIKQNLKDIQFNKDTSPVAWAVKQVKQFMGNSNASSEDIALRTKQLLGNISSGDTPTVSMGKIMSSEMLKHFPDAPTYPKQGKHFIDKASGRAYVVYPEDGQIKWKWADGQK